MALTIADKNSVFAFRSALFVLLSLVINIFCVYYVSNDFLDLDNSQFAPVKSVACSTAAAMVVTICYDFIILRRFSFFRSLVMPSVLGFASSMLSALCMYLLNSGKYSEVVSAILWTGVLSVFPLWQYLIGLNIDYHSRAAYPAGHPGSDGKSD